MTSDDDNASASADKLAVDERGLLEALKELGQPALEPEELPLGSLFFMAPLSSLDLLKPGGEAQALRIIDRLYSGDLIAYGRSIGVRSYRVLAVPTSGWPHLAINWTSGQAERKTVTGRFEGMEWSELQIPATSLSDAPDASPETDTLPIVLADAIALAQRWRERRLIPDGYRWVEAEFWKVNAAKRPDQGETAAVLEAAIRGGELPALWEEDSEWRALPHSAWEASSDRADFARGRLNVGDVVGWPIPYVHGAHAALGLGRHESWRLVFLCLSTLIDWCETRWGQRPSDVPMTQAAVDSPSSAEATSNAAEAANASRKGVGGSPRKYDWDKLGAAFGAWLHDEPGRDRLTPTEHLVALHELCTRLGASQPDRQTAQPYFARWLEAYRIFNADN